jgi:glutathione S-transferase
LIWRAIAEMEGYVVSAGDKRIPRSSSAKRSMIPTRFTEAAAAIRRELKRIDTELQGANWLIGKQVSAADISLFLSCK